jgi:hypothetical protein
VALRLELAGRHGGRESATKQRDNDPRLFSLNGLRHMIVSFRQILSCQACIFQIDACVVFSDPFDTCRNACITAAPNYQEAIDLLGSIESRSLEADVIGYNAAITACEKDYQWPTDALTCLSICLYLLSFQYVFSAVILLIEVAIFNCYSNRIHGRLDFFQFNPAMCR